MSEANRILPFSKVELISASAGSSVASPGMPIAPHASDPAFTGHTADRPAAMRSDSPAAGPAVPAAGPASDQARFSLQHDARPRPDASTPATASNAAVARSSSAAAVDARPHGTQFKLSCLAEPIARLLYEARLLQTPEISRPSESFAALSPDVQAFYRGEAEALVGRMNPWLRAGALAAVKKGCPGFEDALSAYQKILRSGGRDTRTPVPSAAPEVRT